MRSITTADDITEIVTVSTNELLEISTQSEEIVKEAVYQKEDSDAVKMRQPHVYCILSPTQAGVLISQPLACTTLA
jgi:hypothetical protein